MLVTKIKQKRVWFGNSDTVQFAWGTYIVEENWYWNLSYFLRNKIIYHDNKHEWIELSIAIVIMVPQMCFERDERKYTTDV